MQRLPDERARLERAKARLDRLSLYPEPVSLDGVRLRVDDCTPRLLVTTADKAATVPAIPGLEVVIVDRGFWAALAAHPPTYDLTSRADDLAVVRATYEKESE